MISARVVERVVSDRSMSDRFDRPSPLEIANEILTVETSLRRSRVLDFTSAGADKARKIGRTAAGYP